MSTQFSPRAYAEQCEVEDAVDEELKKVMRNLRCDAEVEVVNYDPNTGSDPDSVVCGSNWEMCSECFLCGEHCNCEEIVGI